MTQVNISSDGIGHTLRHLQEAGRRRSECVVLWLGRRENGVIQVHQVYRPVQMARADMFRIPPASMQELLSELGAKQLMIAAQVHSHPFEAFHSKADDTWAIVRHVGALSLVVPDFALKTTQQTFMANTKLFWLTPNNRWREVSTTEIGRCLSIR